MKLKLRDNNKLSKTLPGDTGGWGGRGSGRKAAPDGGGGGGGSGGCNMAAAFSLRRSLRSFLRIFL